MGAKFKLKNKITLSLITAVLFIIGCASKGVETVKYENGLTSILINDKNSLVASVAVFVRVGSIDENPLQAGLSHFVEHLMFKGSKNYPGDLMTRNVENMGGCINAMTSKEFTMYHIDIQQDGVEESVKMLADAVCNPLFPQSEIDMERKVVIEEIQRHLDTPNSVLCEKFYETLYMESALKNSVIGLAQVITNVSRDEICDYYKTHYVPAKMIVVVSGNFDELKIKKLLNETFGKFAKQSIPIEPMLTEKTHKGKDIVEYGKVAVGHMLTGFLGPDVNVDDIYVTALAASVLGGGKSSRLYKALYDDKHLVYSIGSSYLMTKGAGVMYISSIFDPKNLVAIKDEIKKQIEDIINNGISEEELSRAKLAIKTSWTFSHERPCDIAEINGFWQLMGNFKFIDEYISKMEKMTVEDVINFFKKYYSSATVSNVALLPKK
ncbi:MAG: insulinase family protein [Endomicrobium sp.]|uniref:M16 family metallopeptidase n=1 Tax=Candidatus Endomicrobiellum pyrsonymphae TaxID=1408203 RepID=UPI00357DC21E|nr:insulinase family protein [Endomicrobium sp.]